MLIPSYTINYSDRLTALSNYPSLQSNQNFKFNNQKNSFTPPKLQCTYQAQFMYTNSLTAVYNNKLFVRHNISILQSSYWQFVNCNNYIQYNIIHCNIFIDFGLFGYSADNRLDPHREVYIYKRRHRPRRRKIYSGILYSYLYCHLLKYASILCFNKIISKIIVYLRMNDENKYLAKCPMMWNNNSNIKL